MKNIFLVFISAFFLCSCSEPTKKWLRDYQQAKCKWSTTEQAFATDTLQATEKLYQQLAETKTEIERVQAPFLVRISAIEKNIKTTRQKYFDKYKNMTDAHNQIYGHVSTPEYEKKVAENESQKNNAVAELNNKIIAIKKEMESIVEYKTLQQKFETLTSAIQKANAISKQKFKPTFDSLQTVIDNSNYLFKNILQELKETQKQNFLNERDSIRANPCKPINANL